MEQWASGWDGAGFTPEEVSNAKAEILGKEIQQSLLPQVIRESSPMNPGSFNTMIIYPVMPGGRHEPRDRDCRRKPLAVGLQDLTADIPLKTLGTVPEDGLYIVNAGIITKATDSGGGTLLLTVNFTIIPNGLGSSPITQSQSSGSLGNSFSSNNQLITLLQGGIVTYAVTGGSYATGGVYDLFVAFSKVA